jgi:hypothetical protein
MVVIEEMPAVEQDQTKSETMGKKAPVDYAKIDANIAELTALAAKARN